jgi:glc operon protein GlcG
MTHARYWTARGAASLFAITVAVTSVSAQPAPKFPAYGPPLTLDMAKTAMAAADALAAGNDWPVAIAIYDSTGHLVLFQKRDDTHYGSIEAALGKARTALDLRRPTAVMESALAAGGGGLRGLAIPNITPLEGGVPIIRNGQVVGSIAAGGVASADDARVAQAGADALR